MDLYTENKFVSKLTKETLKNNLDWKVDKSKIIIPSMERITSKAYITNIKEKYLRVYRFDYRNYYDEEQWDWVSRIRLEMVDEEKDTLYEFENNYSLEKLFNAIRQSHSGVDDLMKDFLEE